MTVLTISEVIVQHNAMSDLRSRQLLSRTEKLQHQNLIPLSRSPPRQTPHSYKATAMLDTSTTFYTSTRDPPDCFFLRSSTRLRALHTLGARRRVDTDREIAGTRAKEDTVHIMKVKRACCRDKIGSTDIALSAHLI